MKLAAGYYKGKEQTYLKHFFLDRYLETVAFHIGYAYREFVYVDSFSGPWKASDEQLADTSIRIALSKLNDVRAALAKQGHRSNVSAIFVEKDPKSFRDLETALSQYSGSTALQGTFEDNIAEILKLVGPKFAFFFIDPKAGKDSQWRALPLYCAISPARS